MFKTFTFFAVTAIVLISCSQKNSPRSFDVDNTWPEQKTELSNKPGVSSDQIITLFSCRKKSKLGSTTWYYTLQADKSSEVNNTNASTSKVTYKSAQFVIRSYEKNLNISETPYTEIVFNAPVSAEINSLDNLQTSIVAIANGDTVSEIQQNYVKNPYFSFIQSADEILKLLVSADQKLVINITNIDRPGIRNSEQLECNFLNK